MTSGKYILLLVVSRNDDFLEAGMRGRVETVSCSSWKGFRSTGGAEAGRDEDDASLLDRICCCVASMSLVIPFAIRVNLDPAVDGVGGCILTSAGNEAWMIDRLDGRGVGTFIDLSVISAATRWPERAIGDVGLKPCALRGRLGENETWRRWSVNLGRDVC